MPYDIILRYLIMSDVRTTRQTLIQRLKDVGNDEAWKEFYDFYKQSIIGWAVHFGCSPAKADDVFQETMVCLLRKISSFEYDPSKRFHSYLKTIVKGRCYDLFRKESRYIAASGDNSENEQLNSTLDLLSPEKNRIHHFGKRQYLAQFSHSAGLAPGLR